MARKLVLLLSIVAMLGVVAVASADPASDGCYVTAPEIVNEGVNIAVSVDCASIPTANHVFGFQLGTTVDGDYAGTLPSTYTPGTFTSAATGGLSGTLVGSNSLPLYGASRKNTNFVSTTDFTLGSYTLTADTDLTDDDGSVDIDFDATTFKLSDNLGAALSGWLRTINDASTIVNDTDLAWLSGSVSVRSDVVNMTKITLVALNLGPQQYTDNTEASYTTSLPMDVGYTYVEDAAGVVGGTFATAADSDDVLEITVTADMYGHLGCTNEVDLGDAGTSINASTKIGTSGVITLKAGDANNDGTISNSDATVIGLDFGDIGGAINNSTQGDINEDNTVNILDLVHVGRNFSATTGTCA